MKSWPHAPSRLVTQPGLYIVTSGTHLKQHHFRDPERLEFLHDLILATAEAKGWSLEAWSIFSNHYHIVGRSPNEDRSVEELIQAINYAASTFVNDIEGVPGRKVWFSYWQTRLTYERSIMARLSYVHRNPVKHGLVQSPEMYPYCSAAWLMQNSPPSFARTLMEFPIDRVNVRDDFGDF